jgi:hypothetical protein
MIIRFSVAAALLGFALVIPSQPVLAQGASCSAGCAQRCQSSRISKGECEMRCKSICEAKRKKK